MSKSESVDERLVKKKSNRNTLHNLFCQLFTPTKYISAYILNVVTLTLHQHVTFFDVPFCRVGSWIWLTYRSTPCHDNAIWYCCHHEHEIQQLQKLDSVSAHLQCIGARTGRTLQGWTIKTLILSLADRALKNNLKTCQNEVSQSWKWFLVFPVLPKPVWKQSSKWPQNDTGFLLWMSLIVERKYSHTHMCQAKHWLHTWVWLSHWM